MGLGCEEYYSAHVGHESVVMGGPILLRTYRAEGAIRLGL